MYVDSHCHLEMESFDKDRDAVIQKSIQDGLQYMLTVGTEEVYFDRVIEIIDKYPAVYGAIGIHPHNGSEYNQAIADKIRTYAKHPKIVGYGEVGLDFFKNYSPKEAQLKAFREQLELAQEIGLPIIVHSRSAKEETLQVLRDAYQSPSGGVIHCYSYDLDYAKRFLDMGFYISIPGTITYKNNAELMKVVEYIPDDRILAETDAPFLTPHPHRGERNAPWFVKLAVEKMAAIRHTDQEELATMISENFANLFLKRTNGEGTMKPAIIVVDMLEGNYSKERTGLREEEKIVPLVRDVLKTCRVLSIPVIFACDSFLERDFIFKGRMKPHAIRGTGGTKPLSDLEPQITDIILEKRRFSAFFKTDLDQTLRTLDVDTVAVCGINTHFCVLATAFDAVCNDFRTIILEDVSAAFKKEIHEHCVDAYRNSAIYPLLKVMKADEFLKEASEVLSNA